VTLQPTRRLTALVLPAFELKRRVPRRSPRHRHAARPHAGLVASLGATLDEALPVAEIARRVGLGLARQSVQRVADILWTRAGRLYRDNPRHSRAKLLEPAGGREVVHSLRDEQHAWSNAVVRRWVWRTCSTRSRSSRK